MLREQMKSGDVIGGKYRLTERLGVGGMGAVWEALNERTGRKVAIKLILHPTDELRDRLRREAQACGRLAHRNIVEVYDVDETSAGDPCLVMQRLTGQTLADLLSSRRRIEPSLAARIGRDIASALSAAHAAKVIHRDLKPANIFLHREEDGSERGEDDFIVKVVDFGVSKMLTSAVVTSALVGSPAYMSPEQLRVVKDLDHRTDIWSLGIVLYEMLTGKRPFMGSMVEDVIRQIHVAPIAPPSHHVRQLSREFDDLVGLCLERDRGKRIHSALDLARMLDAIKDQRVVVCVGSGAPSEPDTGASPSSRRVVVATADGGANLAVDEFGLAVTVPMEKHFATAATEPSALPAATQILSSTEPIASPLPEWRLAVAARRKSPIAAGASSEELQQGGTMALSPEAFAQMPAGVVAPTAPLAHPPAIASATMTPMASVAGSSPKRRGIERFVMPIGIAGAAIAVLAVGFATRFVAAASADAPEPDPSTIREAAAVTTSAPTAGPMAPRAQAPAPTISTALPNAAAVEPSVNRPKRPPLAEPGRSSGGAVTKPPPKTASSARKPKELPPCAGHFKKPDCRMVRVFNP